MPPSSDDTALVAAHAARDVDTLVLIYQGAAERAEACGDIDRACFFFTQAYVWALEAGHAAAPALHAWLVARGREQ
ncbi:MAG: hypothetical protein AAF566_02615 [Pseudomonadota bacterium]